MKSTGFTSDFIEQLKYKNDIVSTLSKYISLKRMGNNYWACCPFHNEKNTIFLHKRRWSSFIIVLVVERVVM